MGGFPFPQPVVFPGIEPSTMGCSALALLDGRVAWCEALVFTGGWDVRFGRQNGVPQLEYLLVPMAQRSLGRL